MESSLGCTVYAEAREHTEVGLVAQHHSVEGVEEASAQLLTGVSDSLHLAVHRGGVGMVTTEQTTVNCSKLSPVAGIRIKLIRDG